MCGGVHCKPFHILLYWIWVNSYGKNIFFVNHLIQLNKIPHDYYGLHLHDVSFRHKMSLSQQYSSQFIVVPRIQFIIINPIASQQCVSIVNWLHGKINVQLSTSETANSFAWSIRSIRSIRSIAVFREGCVTDIPEIPPNSTQTLLEQFHWRRQRFVAVDSTSTATARTSTTNACADAVAIVVPVWEMFVQIMRCRESRAAWTRCNRNATVRCAIIVFVITCSIRHWRSFDKLLCMALAERSF